MKTGILILFYLLLFCRGGFSQNNPNGIQFWRLTSLSGEAKIKGLYRRQEIIRDNFSYPQKSSFLTGGAFVKTKSFFLSPNFLILDVDAGYYPETSRDKFIVIPDFAEVRTSNKLDIRATFLSQKKITFNTFANFDETYQNRENLTDIKSKSKQLGVGLSYGNKFLPLSVDFRQRQWEQKEIATGRKINLDESVFQSRTNKSFTSRDKNELSYSHNEFINQNENLLRIKNTIDNINFNNNISFDEKKNYYFNSMISNVNQQGNINLKRFQALENLTFKLPENIIFSTNYNFNLTRQELNKLNQQSIQSSLDHRLYKSLYSRLFFEHNQMNHTSYRQKSNQTGMDIKYTKLIPTGQLSLSYTYFREHENMNSDPVSLFITNEEYIFSDIQIILFKRSDVTTGSVVVKDATGTIIYQLNLDYILIDQYPYLEVRRVPGGLIANNAAVYIDYIATQPGAYKYDTDNHMFASNVLLFKRKLEVYYRFAIQDYKNLSKTEFLTLNYYTMNMVGGRLDFGFINGGAEYEVFNSTIIPYQRARYFISIQKDYHEKILLILNGNIQNYHLINENTTQKYLDVTGKIAYSISKQTRIDLDLMYRNQSGRRIDLDLITAKSEITSVIKQLYLTFGVELYWRNFVDEKINFKGTYISITRRF